MTITHLDEKHFLLLCMAGSRGPEYLKRQQRKKRNHCTFSSQLRADQMPGPSWELLEGQLMYILFLSMHVHQ